MLNPFVPHPHHAPIADELLMQARSVTAHALSFCRTCTDRA